MARHVQGMQQQLRPIMTRLQCDPKQNGQPGLPAWQTTVNMAAPPPQTQRNSNQLWPKSSTGSQKQPCVAKAIFRANNCLQQHGQRSAARLREAGRPAGPSCLPARAAEPQSGRPGLSQPGAAGPGLGLVVTRPARRRRPALSVLWCAPRGRALVETTLTPDQLVSYRSAHPAQLGHVCL